MQAASVQTSGNWLLAQHQACTQKREQLALSALVSGPTASLPAVHRVSTAALACKKGLQERQLGRSYLWPKHGSQYYLRCVKTEGCLCMMLLGCLLVYISACCCPEGSMHISLAMSVGMLTIDLCSSELAYCSSDQLRVPTVWYIMHLRNICMHRKDAMNSL